VLKQPDEIRGAYSATETAENYIDERFTSAWGSVLHAAQVGIVNDVIATHDVKTVLEIAPGPARISRDVRGFETGYLCEFNEAMVKVARHRLAAVDPRWHIVRGDGFHLPFRRPVDLVYSFRFIRHFGAADRGALYHQIRSVLNDRGLLVFDAVNVDVGLPSVIREGLERHRIYDEFYKRETLIQELEQHGFTPIALHDVIRHMTLQQQIQVLVGPRSNRLARRLIELLEYVPGSPLEWIVVCQKTTAH
jgi:hypothetical protein